MMLFGPKRTDLSRQDALSVKPVQLVQARFAATDDGGAKLTVRLKSTGWSTWLMRLPEGATKTFELDELGVFIWNSCDGKTSVQQMIRRLARERKLTLREVEVATLQFLQTLIRKGLVGAPVREDKDGK
jgi:hypothetical protein